MPDWLKPMQQTFEYYEVDPGTWKDKKRLINVKSSSISRDIEADTLGSASINLYGTIQECYVRIYMITIQDGIREQIPLGTVLVQTPSVSFDGFVKQTTLDAYTPLIELKENAPPLGYYIAENAKVMDEVGRLTEEHLRAPVVKVQSDKTLFKDFIANGNDTWISFNRDLMNNADYRYDLDELGRILFAPKQDTASLQPVWTFDDSNSSILYPDLDIEHDIYGIPNAIEVVYADSKNQYYAKVVNDDENSPISTVNRGREICKRIDNPEFPGEPTQAMITEYANRVLREQSSLEYTVSYTHGYCPVRPGDCVRLNYKRAGLNGVKARVISQNIKCEPGCPVSEKAVYTKKLWEG